jgi:hypothetical protein
MSLTDLVGLERNALIYNVQLSPFGVNSSREIVDKLAK